MIDDLRSINRELRTLDALCGERQLGCKHRSQETLGKLGRKYEQNHKNIGNLWLILLKAFATLLTVSPAFSASSIMHLAQLSI